MADLNRVFLMGRLTREPDVRHTPSGAPVAELSLAITEYYRSKEGEREERTVFVDVIAWNRQAENCGKYLFKGSPVMIEGRLQFDQWESKKGESRSKLRVRAERVQFLGSKPAETPEHQAGTDATENEDTNIPL